MCGNGCSCGGLVRGEDVSTDLKECKERGLVFVFQLQSLECIILQQKKVGLERKSCLSQGRKKKENCVR